MEVKSIIHFVWFRLGTICFNNFTSYVQCHFEDKTWVESDYFI